MAGRARDKRLPVGQALALGLLHGPAELLPVSSSGHVTALPWLLGWRYAELDGEARKSFEVALHAGSAAALLLAGAGPADSRGARADLSPSLRDPRQLLLLALAVAPAGAAGLAFERPIERYLGTPAAIAAGLALGAAVMIAADRARQDREADQAGPADAAWLGLAQATALLPGVSRAGATLATARLRGFSERSSWRLSAAVAMPVIGGAAALKLVRLLRRRPPEAEASALLAGAGASFGSTVLAARVLRPLDRGWPLWPFASYRLILALALAARLSRPRGGSRARLRRTSGP